MIASIMNSQVTEEVLDSFLSDLRLRIMNSHSHEVNVRRGYDEGNADGWITYEANGRATITIKINGGVEDE